MVLDTNYLDFSANCDISIGPPLLKPVYYSFTRSLIFSFQNLIVGDLDHIISFL